MYCCPFQVHSFLNGYATLRGESGSRPHSLFRPLFCFQGASIRPVGQRSTGSRSLSGAVVPRVALPGGDTRRCRGPPWGGGTTYRRAAAKCQLRQRIDAGGSPSSPCAAAPSGRAGGPPPTRRRAGLGFSPLTAEPRCSSRPAGRRPATTPGRTRRGRRPARAPSARRSPGPSGWSGTSPATASSAARSAARGRRRRGPRPPPRPPGRLGAVHERGDLLAPGAAGRSAGSGSACVLGHDARRSRPPAGA